MALHPGPKVMIPLFVKLMEDSDPGVKLRILDAVTDAGPAALPGLIEALNNPKAAYWSCIVLRQLGPAAKSAVPALTKTLADKNPEIRREATLALGAIGAPAETAAPQIAALLEDPLVREAATFALGQIGKMPSKAIVKVKDNTRSDDKFLSTISYWALARVQPDNKELRRETTTRLVEMLGDKNPFVRAAAGRGLASLPPAPEITLPIWDKFMATADEETAHHALNALAGLGPAAVPRLMKLLKYEKLRAPIAEIFGSIGHAAAPATAALSAHADRQRSACRNRGGPGVGKNRSRRSERRASIDQRTRATGLPELACDRNGAGQDRPRGGRCRTSDPERNEERRSRPGLHQRLGTGQNASQFGC